MENQNHWMSTQTKHKTQFNAKAASFCMICHPVIAKDETLSGNLVDILSIQINTIHVEVMEQLFHILFVYHSYCPGLILLVVVSIVLRVAKIRRNEC